MFGRKKKTSAAETGAEELATTEEPTRSSETGPFDEADVAGPEGRIDLGGLWLRPAQGMEVRIEIDPSTDVVSAVQVSAEDATVQLQCFAAPRSSGIWDEIRGEIADMITTQRGTVEEAVGPFGTELRTRLPQPGQDGRTVFAPAVFAGVDGPRWLLRAVYSGQAAVDEQARAALDAVVAEVVVVRGKDPMAPREMIPLTMPDTPSS